ncbi:sigma-54-dependent Fis family transcriptional regulator [Xanthomonas cassavae CFBP 4642]|uniref:Sigma-54-dependent Fis family transcriptional regulator n=1 Tax=Xanthomonas cassavae CFBP 4642 TaxID=1219375 RepID=A0ABS8HAH0_9XANT|nr:sigma-54-dependent Fis family transcriptional regulator [Xanthomonas cassavae]MCC4619158.1 sigma-54-dependent Fis family transcriptional regulator [Xanthomonas cassavae CFBP 4642]
MSEPSVVAAASISLPEIEPDTLRHIRRLRDIAPLAAPLSRSWRRCLDDYALLPEATPEPLVHDALHVRERQQRLGEVLRIARVEMENLYEQIAGSGYAVIFGDAEATVLHSVHDSTLLREFRQAGLFCGASWAECHQGTNGLGTCAAERTAVSVHRGEHYLTRHLPLSCSGAPILDPHGGLLAVLDASTPNAQDSKQIQRHTMALVSMSAAQISRSHFLNQFGHAFILRFHSRPEFAGLLHEALIAMDTDGRVLAVNEAVLEQLGKLDRSQLVGRDISQVMQLDFDTIEHRAGSDAGTLWSIRCACHGRRFHALVRPPRARAAPASIGGAGQVAPECDLQPGEHVGSDPRMRHNLANALKLAAHRVSILLRGDTGTGKEEFAKAVHRGSPWASNAFVAINCAAIPEALIESELFGYARGAFTDAAREGRHGKLLQASGGTLFLDEIGDMPLPLQSRLLRVLEEQCVTPLGSERAVPLELHVISASHRDLAQRVASGEFREDLYYRLNGVVLHLPPLRERSDKAELIRTLLREENCEQGVRISEEAMHKLLSYTWPGNLRQLRNVLRTAAVLCSDGVIGLPNLPQEIVDAGSAPCLVDGRAVAADDMSGRAALDQAERLVLQQQLERYRWNVSRTADALGISRNTLYRKLRKHGLDTG